MATTNPTVTGAWTLLVDEGDEFLLTLPVASQTIYVAIGGEVTSSDSNSSETDADLVADAPALGTIGHPLRPGEDGMNRALIGPGPVFAKCIDPAASVAVALTAWTPA